MNLSTIFNDARGIVSKHAPEILIGMGVAGALGSIIMAVEATPKALMLIENEKKSQSVEYQDDETGEWEPATLTKMDVVKSCWFCYIPTAVTFIISAGCIFGANAINARRNTALATAYIITETTLSEYRNKVIETIGEKKERGIRDKIAEERIKNNPVTNSEIIITGGGDVLCYDMHGGRYFKSDIEKIRKIVNDLNYRLSVEMYIPLNDFYYEVGLSSTRVGRDLGWNAADGLIEPHFSSHLTDDGTPCLAIDYTVAPRYGYEKLM